MQKVNIKIPIALRQKDIEEYFGVSASYSKKLFKDMLAEVKREDSKLTYKAYIRAGKLVYFHSVAVYWFLQHRDLLEDQTARKRVKEFNIKDYKELF